MMKTVCVWIFVPLTVSLLGCGDETPDPVGTPGIDGGGMVVGPRDSGQTPPVDAGGEDGPARPVPADCDDDTGCDDAQYCDNGTCVADVCVQGSRFCEGGNPRECDATGRSAADLEACASGETCMNGACVSDNSCIAGDPFDPATMRADVAFLASDAMRGRAPGTPEDQLTREYIAERFECLGLEPGGENGSYFSGTFQGGTTNVIGFVRGSDPNLNSEIIVIGGHHDHLGLEGGQIMNGANDNASGTAAVMAIARAIKQLPTPPSRTFVFVTFGAEEYGLVGSERYARNPPTGLSIDDTVYMFNLDMVGTYSQEDEVFTFGLTDGSPARTFFDARRGDYSQYNFTRVGRHAPSYDSDFENFCDQGIPYFYYETPDPCWHEACDDTDRLDYDGMSDLIRLKYEVALDLANTTMDLRGTRSCRNNR